MTWFRADDDLPEHVKADAIERAAGSPAALAAAWMTWLHMGCDCAKRRTDGLFDRARAHRAVRLPPAMVDAALASLVSARLLDLEGDAYRLHDWADYQPTKEELDADRKANADRQKAWRIRQREQREARARNTVSNGVTDGVTNAVRNERLSRETSPGHVSLGTGASVTAPRPVPSRPVPSTEEERERAEPAAATAPVQPPPAVKTPKPRTPKPPPAMELPPTDQKARAVYDAILADPVLAAITARPADLATRMVAPGAYPGVNVLSQVHRAAAFVAGGKRSYRDGRAFLLGWMGRADIEPVAPAGGAAPQPDRFGRVPLVPVQPPVVKRGDLAVDRPAMKPGPEAHAFAVKLRDDLRAGRVTVDREGNVHPVAQGVANG